MGCVSNSDYRSAANRQASAIVEQATVDAAIQVALALWQRNTSRDIANMQEEIADRQMKLAEAIQEHAEKFWPREKALVDDTFGEQRATENYAAASAGRNALAIEALSQAHRDWLAEARLQCMSPTRCEDARFNRMSMLTRTDAMSHAVRHEEARTQEINDRRYERQYKVLGIGRGRLSEVRGFQGAYLRAGGSSSAMLTSSINSAMDLYGYSRARNNPGQWGYGTAIRETWGAGAPYTPADPRPQGSISPAAPSEVTKGPSEIDAGFAEYERMLEARRNGGIL